MFLNNDVKEIVHSYDWAFLHYISPADFEKFYEIIKKYSISKVVKKEPHYYYIYLIKCSKQFPEKSIDLIKHYKEYDMPNNFTGPHYNGSEPVKIVVGALNGLFEKKEKNVEYINKAMNLFDEMLVNQIFRGSAFDVLSKI